MKGIAVAEGHREKGKEIGRETERERERIYFPLLVYSPIAATGRLHRAEAGNSLWFSVCVWKDLKHLDFLPLLPQVLLQRARTETKQLEFKPVPIWDAGITNRSLTHYRHNVGHLKHTLEV